LGISRVLDGTWPVLLRHELASPEFDLGSDLLIDVNGSVFDVVFQRGPSIVKERFPGVLP